jgi:hypothetical protein
MRTPPPDATVPTIIDGRDEMTQATYERTMCRLRFVIRMFMVVLLVLVARSVTDRLTVAVVITGAPIAFLPIASVGPRRQGRRLRPYADARQSGSSDYNSALPRGLASASAWAVEADL